MSQRNDAQLNDSVIREAEPRVSLELRPAATLGNLAEDQTKKILIIKHSALGDFILATAAMKAIRHHHAQDKITLLTTKPFLKMAKDSGFFDEVLIDDRPKFCQLFKILRLAEIFRVKNFSRVYDLQTSDRSSSYYHLFPLWRKPEWVGIVKSAKHFQKNPDREKMHTLDRHADQLMEAGIISDKKPDISWLKSDVSKFNLPEKFALIIAGGAAHRPEKRWHVQGWAELCRFLLKNNIAPVLIGTDAEKEMVENILICHSGASRNLDLGLRPDDIINLIGQTSFADIAELARNAVITIGNDTGPTHIAAATGAPFIVLFSSSASNPDLCAPRGERGLVIAKNNLQELKAEEVISAAKSIIDTGAN